MTLDQVLELAQLVAMVPLWRLAHWLMRVESRLQQLEKMSHDHQQHA